MTFAVIPAAGQSIRMGRPKLLLPLQGRPVLSHTIRAFRDAGVQHVLVVAPCGLPDLCHVAEQSGAYVLRLDVPTADMRATIERGLAWLEEHFQPAPDAEWFLTPADHPVLEVDVIRELLRVPRTNPRHTMIVPTFEDRRGHPVLLRWSHVQGIRDWPAGQGLNTYMRAYDEQTLAHPVTSAGILVDMDTPEDYERLRSLKK